MALSVAAAGPVLEDGGTMFVATGAEPNGVLVWLLTGPGTLTPTSSTADARGVGTASYNAAGSTSGDRIVVRVTSYG